MVFRIAKNKLTREKHRREFKLLSYLNAYITKFILPRPKYYVETAESFPFGLMGYSKIEGKPLRPEDIEPNKFNYLAKQIAELLLTLHRVRLSPELQALDIPTLVPTAKELEGLWHTASPHLSQSLATKEMSILEAWWNESKSFWSSLNYSPVLVHGDVWFENILVDKDMTIKGILDFEGVSVGDLAQDLAVQGYVSQEFRDCVIHHYSSLGGIIGNNLSERMARLMGLRELRGLEYGLKTSVVDPEAVDKIRNTIILSNQ